MVLHLGSSESGGSGLDRAQSVGVLMTECKTSNKLNPQVLGGGGLRTVLKGVAASFHFIFTPIHRERRVGKEYSLGRDLAVLGLELQSQSPPSSVKVLESVPGSHSWPHIPPYPSEPGDSAHTHWATSTRGGGRADGGEPKEGQEQSWASPSILKVPLLPRLSGEDGAKVSEPMAPLCGMLGVRTSRLIYKTPS